MTATTAEKHLQRAWYLAVVVGGLFVIGAAFLASFGLLMGAILVVGLGHGIRRRSWVAAAALLAYAAGNSIRAAWLSGDWRPALGALLVGYFFVQALRAALWFLREGKSTSGNIAA